MPATLRTEIRPEAMSDVPGVCELTLTRAVVQYRDLHEIDMPGGRIEDIGLALVLEGRYASAAQVLDLGSAEAKYLDLSAELVVLDWVYEPTLRHVAALVRDRRESSGEPVGGELERYCFDLGLRVLARSGFSPITRPVILRIGFRDICRDLDLHEGTSVRIVLGKGRITRVHLDYDANALVFRTASVSPDRELERALVESFGSRDLRKMPYPGSGLAYQLRLPLPLSLAEARQNLAIVRRGLTHMLARFEAARYESIHQLTETFGERDTLARLNVRDHGVDAVPILGGMVASGMVVH